MEHKDQEKISLMDILPMCTVIIIIMLTFKTSPLAFTGNRDNLNYFEWVFH